MSEVEQKAEYDIDELFSNSHKQGSGNNLTCILWGETESGKTYLSLDFPGPLRVMNLDYGLTENQEKQLNR